MKNQGPSLKIITTCNNCMYLDETLDGNRCLKLKNYLFKDHTNYIRPHELCPFLKSEKEMLENKLAEIEAEESKKLEKIITDIFSGFDFSIDEYSGEIYVKSESEISLSQFKEFEKRFPEYDLKIDSYDSDTIQIRISK